MFPKEKKYEKIEEEAIIDDYFLFNPLMYDYPFPLPITSSSLGVFVI